MKLPKAPHLPVGTDLADLAKAMGERLQATAVFGPPVTQRRTTVIPVARARFGLGGGRGGQGAGGGGSIRPTGFIVVEGRKTRYEPIRRSSVIAPLLLLAVAACAGAFLRTVTERRGSPGSDAATSGT